MEKFILFAGAHLFYTDTGEGQPVVLLHGFAEDHTVWKYQFDELKDHCRLIIPDLPGSSRSEMLEKEHVSIEDYAHCIVAILQKESIGACILIGHSMGGYVALAFANIFPDMLIGLGLIHSTAFADSEEKKEMRRKAIAVIGDKGAFAFIKNTTPTLFTTAFKEQHSDSVSELVEGGKAFKKEVLQQYYAAMASRPDGTNLLREIEVPVLFVIGETDGAAPLSDLLNQVHLPAISSIHIMPETGHMGFWEQPAIVSSYILDFVELAKTSLFC